jgi:hypothetical protein
MVFGFCFGIREEFTYTVLLRFRGSDYGQRTDRPMSTDPQRTCPSCGNELSGAMEFCSVCMLRKALASGVDSGDSSVCEDTVKPTNIMVRLKEEGPG